MICLYDKTTSRSQKVLEITRLHLPSTSWTETYVGDLSPSRNCIRGVAVVYVELTNTISLTRNASEALGAHTNIV